MTILHCPKCNNKVDEMDLEVGQTYKKHCQKCGVEFLIIAEIKLKVYLEAKEVKEK